MNKKINTQGSKPITPGHYLANGARVVLCAAAILTAGVWSASAQRSDSRAAEVFKTATFNAYIGADLTPVIALDPAKEGDNYFPELVATTTEVYKKVVQSDPPRRMAGIAREIAATRPHVVAVQELYNIAVAPAEGTTPGVFVETYNYLDLLKTALGAEGLHYTVASVSQEAVATVPMIYPGAQTLGFGQIVDHDAILVRNDVPSLAWGNPQSGHYEYNLSLNGITLTRGWCSVDLKVGNSPMRFVCTHLEEETVPQIQALQANEMLLLLATTSLPTIVAGDLNADSLNRNGSPVYGIFAKAGFKDAWLKNYARNPAGGLTWGHDAELSDPSQGFSWRIDHVLYRGGDFNPTAARTLDFSLGSVPPLWPSDHAGLAVQFILNEGNGRSGAPQHR